MVGARSGAMGLNRIIDARIDAANPRTRSREIPAGKIEQRAACDQRCAMTAIIGGFVKVLEKLRCVRVSVFELPYPDYYILINEEEWQDGRQAEKIVSNLFRQEHIRLPFSAA